MMWAGNVARRRDRRVPYRVLVRCPKERDHLKDLGVEEKIISKFIQ